MSGSDPNTLAPASIARKHPSYRALVLDADAKVLRTENLLAHNDAEALALAESLAWEFDIELWDGLRFIEQIAARSGRRAGATDGEPIGAE